MTVCPKCHYHSLQQRADQNYILSCPNCGTVFFLKPVNGEVLLVNMDRVNRLARQINDFIANVKEENAIVAEVMLALTAVPILQAKEQKVIE